MFRFGIIGVSSIVPKFIQAAAMAGCETAAIASRDSGRARQFAEEHDIPRSYGSYAEMLENETPDCVYIANLPLGHFDAVMLCLKHRIPVLCEKAMFTSAKEAETAFAFAREQKVFAAEALWSNFLPANETAKEWLESGEIGKPVFCDCMMGWRPPCPSRFYDAKNGGGPDYDLTVYAYEVMAYLLGENPEVTGVEIRKHPDGINASEQITLKAGDCLCTIRMSYVTANELGLTLSGEYGLLQLPRPHISREAILTGRDGTVNRFYDDQTTNGFVFEIEEAIHCIREGCLESRRNPQSRTLACARVFDAVRAAEEKSNPL